MTKEEQILKEAISGFGYHLPTMVKVLFKLSFKYLGVWISISWRRFIY